MVDRWPVVVSLGVGLFLATAGLAQAPAASPPDLRAAERELEAARHELEKIAGPDWREVEAPALPDLPADGELALSEEALSEEALSEEERARMDRLLDARPEDWSEQDRQWVRELLPVDVVLRAALVGGEKDEGGGDEGGPEQGEAAASAELATRGLAILRAVKVVTLGDRLAFLDGDLGALLDGVELREGVAERLYLQQGILGSALGSVIHLGVLRDVRRTVARAGTPRDLLERVDARLLEWRNRVPSPAVVVALEGLSNLDRAQEMPRASSPVAEPAAVLFMAPMARDFADLARTCREAGCAEAANSFERRRKTGDDPYRAITDLMMPNYLGLVGKLGAVAELTAVARLAVGLRLEALEMGGYPPTVEELPPSLAAELDGIDGLEYERSADGARLRLASESLLSQWPEARRARLEPLLLWELPGKK